MNSIPAAPGHIAIIGAGPGGMAAALAAHRVGFKVSLFERYREIKAGGNILNLWPPPQKGSQRLLAGSQAKPAEQRHGLLALLQTWTGVHSASHWLAGLQALPTAQAHGAAGLLQFPPALQMASQRLLAGSQALPAAHGHAPLRISAIVTKQIGAS